MIYKNQSYYLMIILFLSNLAFSQERRVKVSMQSNPLESGYWWLEKNNFGMNPSALDLEIDWQLNTIKTEYKSHFVYQKSNQLYFKESYIKHNFSNQTFLRLGLYYRDFSKYLNDELSSGSMLISKNAQPMPKIGFVASKTLRRNKNYSFDFGIAHGFFDKSGRGFDNFYIKAPFLHEKFLYLNIHKNQRKMGIGIVHEAIWSGSTPELGQQPNTLKDFFKVFISADGEYIDGPHANALGSHLGIWDFYYQINTDEKIMKFYYQHFFEDTSSLRFANSIDGLWGIELENYIPNTNLLIEYLDTTHCCYNPPYQDDNYYANFQYVAGWTHKNFVLGNPFIRNTAAFRELIKVFHIGMKIDASSHYFKIQSSRKINTKDTVKYKISAGKTIKDSLKLNIFIANDDVNDIGFGAGISYLIQ